MKTKKLFVSVFFLFVTFSVQAGSLQSALEHLKQLHPKEFSEYDLTRLAKTHTLDLVKSGLTDSDFVHLTPLCQLDNIQVLDFRLTRITGAGFKEFAEHCGKWESIIEVNLAACPLIDEYLVSLNSFPNIEMLNIDFENAGPVSHVTGEFFHHLNLKHLKGIWAMHTNLIDQNALVILNWPALTVFAFPGTPLSKEVLSRLGNEKINYFQKPWVLKRLQYEIATNPLHNQPCADYEGCKALFDLVLEKQFITQETYQWAMENNIGVYILKMGNYEAPYGVFKLRDVCPEPPKSDVGESQWLF